LVSGRKELDSAIMDSFRELGRALLMFGGLIVLVGAFFYFGGKMPFRLGRLPGDILYEGKHTTFYFPIITSLLLSVGLSLLLWLLSRLRR
jgi:Protein of unknown function (DUF2905)